MLREAVGAGLVGLGLIGGAAAVTYDDSGSATVEIEKGGVTRTTELGGQKGGPTYSCPADIDETLAPFDERSGRIKLTEEDVAAQLDQLDAQYPQQTVPPTIARQYNDLLDRDKQLVQAFNESVDKRNAILVRECTKE